MTPLMTLKSLAHRLRPLPAHPYQEQFSKELDMPRRDWADRIILIASTPRSGSHFLGHMLRDTGEFGVPLEYLHPGNAFYWRRRFGHGGLNELFPQMVRLRTSPNGTFCMKAHWQQFRPFADDLDSLTRGIGIDRIIWISRRNQLSQAISFVIADQTGAWISGAPEKAPARYDYSEIVQAAQSIRDQNLAWKAYLGSGHSGRVLPVIYEDLLASDNQEQARIGAFLGLKVPMRPSARTSAQRSSRNAEWKERFRAEVKPEHGWILEDPAWIA